MKTFTNLAHRAFKKCASLGTINKKRYYLFIITMLLTLGVGNAWGAEGDVLKTYDTGSSSFTTGYGRKTGDNFVFYGQKGFFGTNKADTHNKACPTAADLPVVRAHNSLATTNTTGYYYLYTSEAVANVGKVEVKFTATNGSSTVNAYVVSSSTEAASGSATWTKVTLAPESPKAQGVNVASVGTYTFTFDATETTAKYYGVVFVTSSFWRATDLTFKLYEGEASTPKTPYTVTFHTTATNEQEKVEESAGSGVTPPEMEAECGEWSFQGWSESSSNSETSTTVLSIITLENGKYYPTADVNLYPVYTKTSTGGGIVTWNKVTTAPADWSGEYLIVNSDYAMTSDLKEGSAEFLGASVTVSNNQVTSSPTDKMIWIVEKNGNTAQYSFKNKSTGTYAKITGGSSKNAALSNTVVWFTIGNSSTSGVWKINSVDYNTRCFSYFSSEQTFRTYANSTNTTGNLYKKEGSSSTTNYYSYPECSGEPITPVASLTVNPTTIDFGTVYEGATVADKTVAVNFANLNGAVTYSGLSTPFSADGAINATGDEITISADASTIGEYSQTLTVASTVDSKTAEVTVKMNVVAAPAPTGTFEKFTGTIEEGDYVLVANETTDALKNTITSNRFGCGTVQVVDDKIVNPDKSVIWHIAANGTYWTMYNESTTKYAGGTTTKNQGALLDDVTDFAKWTITVDGEGVYTFENYGRSQESTDANNKFLSKNSQHAYWATYGSGQTNPVLYKKSDGKQPAGLVYETNKYRNKLGDAFATPTLTNPNSLDVTYSSSNNDVAEVAADGKVTTKAVGTVEITATFAGNETHREGSAAYTICVTEHAGTQADPYSVADARRVIDVMETAEGVYATGIVSEIVTEYDSEFGNITYNISVDGTTTGDQLQAYRGFSYDGDWFTSNDDIKVGDEVVIKGTLKKYSTTYEFDAGNQLVSLNRTKEQAGLAYAETEHNANVGEDFAEPALTNPNNLTVTYSSSNTTLATVNATTGEVTILAAGKVTITASTTGDASYSAGSASYNITITDPSLAVAILPFYFNGKQADIEGTAGMTHYHIDADDYNSAPYLKMNTTGDWLVIHFDSEPEKLSYDIKNNSFSGGTFSVQESVDGETYIDVKVHTEITGTQSEEHTLLSTSRYVKFIYTEKVNGNVGLGNIRITKPDDRQEAGLAWDPETVTLTVGDAFTAPTLNNPNYVSDITYESSDETVATVTSEGEIALASATGTATITATFAGDGTYKPATATCTITVNPKTETVVILAQYDGQWYALKNVEETAGKVLAALPVNYVGGKLYNVEEADKATIEWQRAAVTDGIIFKNGENYISGTANDTDLKLSTTECAWTLDGTTYKLGNRTFIYRAQANGFKNYNATTTPGTEDYSNLPVVTAPVYGTGTITSMENLTPQMYGTICLENNVVGYESITFYEVAGKEDNKVIFDEVTELEAGMPYIYIADSETATIVKGNETAAEAGNHKSLQGTFTQIDPAETNTLTGNYILYNNTIKKCGANCGLRANKAYFIASVLEGLLAPQAQMPGRRRVSLNTTGENAATGIGDVVVPTEQATKVIINGQLIIIRDGVKYNVQGVRL